MESNVSDDTMGRGRETSNRQDSPGVIHWQCTGSFEPNGCGHLRSSKDINVLHPTKEVYQTKIQFTGYISYPMPFWKSAEISSSVAPQIRESIACFSVDVVRNPYKVQDTGYFQTALTVHISASPFLKLHLNTTGWGHMRFRIQMKNNGLQLKDKEEGK